MFYIAIVRVHTRPYIRIKMLTRNNFVNAGLLFLVALLFFVFVSDDSEAATHTVDKFGGSDYTNITQAVDNASAGDIIRVASRNYHDAVEVDKKLTIIGILIRIKAKKIWKRIPTIIFL